MLGRLQGEEMSSDWTKEVIGLVFFALLLAFITWGLISAA